MNGVKVTKKKENFSAPYAHVLENTKNLFISRVFLKTANASHFFFTDIHIFDSPVHRGKDNPEVKF